jgi:hypothetical protein
VWIFVCFVFIFFVLHTFGYHLDPRATGANVLKSVSLGLGCGPMVEHLLEDLSLSPAWRGKKAVFLNLK